MGKKWEIGGEKKFIEEGRSGCIGANKTPAAAVDTGTESDGLELRDVGLASGTRGDGLMEACTKTRATLGEEQEAT